MRVSTFVAVFAVAACTPAAVPHAASVESPPTPISWQTLQNRQIQLPALSADGSCPVGQLTQPDPSHFGKALGADPVYAVIDRSTIGAQVLNKILWAIKPSYSGPVLIRGKKLEADSSLLFSVIGQAPVGLQPALTLHANGSDVALYTEMQLMTPGTSSGAPWRAWPSYTYPPEAGCYGWQADGSDFQLTIVIRAT